MSSCYKCGQYDIADGGIGCTCNSCIHCNQLSKSEDSNYCWLCGPCKNCGKSMQMHTDSMLDICLPKRKSEAKSKTGITRVKQ
jgi:hypothetical protein